MRSGVLRLAIILAIVVAAAFAVITLNLAFPSFTYGLKYVYAALILVAGVFITREVASIVGLSLRDHAKRTVLVAENAVTISGYVISMAAAFLYASFSPTALLASAAFSGLVLGLALQPTLGSFFAGMLILVSGVIRPGNQVRIMTWHIPFQWAMNPGYKYFSPDQIYAGYMAEVIEIGLFFTTVITEEGQTMKIPNTIIATDAAVVTYTNRDYIFNVRYEFSNRLDPNVVLKRVKEEVASYPVVNCFINEQSDKSYFIVKIVMNAVRKDHALIKSEVLARLILLNRELEGAGSAEPKK